MELRGLSERLALAKASRQLGIADVNVLGLAHRMVCETVRRRNFIDHIINSVLAPRSIQEFRLGVRAFLRLYVHETLFEKAKFEEAVEMVRIGRAVLGWRELHELEKAFGELYSSRPNQALRGLCDEERVSLLTYNPRWFVKYCFKLLGRSQAIRFLESTTKATPTYVRINTLKGSEKAVLREIEKDGVHVEKVEAFQHTYLVSSTKQPLTRTPSFRKGLFYIQDKASCLATEVASPEPEDTVLDVCAAPGAKTTYLAQLMKNTGAIYSIDYSERRMKVWMRETQRMGVKIARPIIADACSPLPLKVKADLVVLDPPCTSTGAFARTPSAKWRLTKRSVWRMADIQWQMLNQCAEHVEDGGFLVYSTCSVCLEENELLIERFLKWHPEFTLVKAKPRVGSPGLRGLTGCQRLYPHIHNCNGFFVAKLLKEA